jgi:hypothetical protein
MGKYDNFTERPGMTRIGEWRVEKFNNKIIDKILEVHGGNNIDLLEIGPGKGKFAQNCSQSHHISYHGIEENETMANNLVSEGFDVLAESAPPIGFEKDFHVIYMNQVFEHIPPNVLPDFIMEMSESLLDDGLLVIVSPDYNVWKEYFFDSDYTHVNVTTRERTRQMLYDYGFKISDSGYTASPFEGRFQTGVVASIIDVLDMLVIPELIIGTQKYRKIKSSFYRSFYTIARKNE